MSNKKNNFWSARFPKLIRKISFIIFLFFNLYSVSFAQDANDGMGQIIQIQTNLHSFVGKPTWLLIIRDVDHGQNIPYLFDIRTGANTWIAITYGRNYLITVSSLQFSPYGRHPFRSKKIDNFCQLQTNGRIIRGASISILIEGDLSPNTNSFSCHISKYFDPNFTIVNHLE